uniref:Dolichyl-diphosphooligosaccharide--protein glycosyltransferase subunit 1 n=1 Tax=Salarias fasciatus TaxID=181472 RepID=A0A672I2D3_SALFA
VERRGGLFFAAPHFPDTPSGVSADGLVNEDVKRTVDLSTHLAKITAEIALSNQGHSAVHSFVLAVEPELAPHLAYIGMTFSHVLRPFPTHITQAERQLVIFQGNHYLYSPYPTRSQTTRVRLASKTVESYTKLGNPSKADEIIEYGPFRDVAPFMTLPNGSASLAPSRCLTGETLPPSRFTILPASAQDVYYRDEIGNISTSHLQVLDDSVEVEVRPRFPLFGGWKTHYIIGYNLPSYEYLHTLGDQYALKMRLVDHVYDDQVIDLLTVKIILPEGARNIHMDMPYKIDRLPNQLHYTYLDTFGRPVLVATKNNLVEHHIQDVVVHYNFNKILMLQEPLLVVGAFYILFFTVIIYVRLDFAITKDPAAEVRMKVASITEQVLTLVNKRLGLYRHMDEVVNRYKQSRDTGALNSGRKTLEADHRALTNEISSLQARLKAEGSDLADKVGEVQKLDGQVKELVCRSCQEAERLVAGKVKKEAYIESEKTLTGKRQELVGRIDSLLDAL